MHNQPQRFTPTTPAPSVSNAAAVCLAVSAVAGFALVVLIYVDVFTPLDPVRGVTGLFAAICSVAGFGYISRSAEDRNRRREGVAVRLVLDRIDRMEERMDEHAEKLTEQGQETAASVFVGAAASGRHLNAVPRG